MVDFYKVMNQLFRETGSKSIEEEGEGTVIYFTDGSRVISLAKLKTLEYRVFRKLREKAKNVLGKDIEDIAPILKKFIRECEELS